MVFSSNPIMVIVKSDVFPLNKIIIQEGASEEELNMLPKYIFRQTGSSTRSGMDMAGPSGGVMSLISTRLSGAAAEQTLSAEDAECCICLSTYENNVELRELPCGHHFHSACVDRWLRMNPTCPLCKFNVSKDENISRVEHV
ncbi:hypothetical protein KP509_14G077300 [Ceratopteris richardii]|uniref:RING-type E3 ubiquitin transferase n=1 Tax=Ceratopteris richardii TaxID=49495 RepID=A0A8T2TD99_CERRI|nr:hypothetical protein KP509_14G077300 [Ceratopteris richardii]